MIDLTVGKMQRHFEPMTRQIDAWQQHLLPDRDAKLLIDGAFVEGRLRAPRHLDRDVHDHYFQPRHPEFKPRTVWSLSNAFTSAFKELDLIPRFRATAALATFLRDLS